ncbi:MAG: MarR family transcriptional regulator [bacterium]|nr:MarR family transcriptional regulator [bacterium]
MNFQIDDRVRQLNKMLSELDNLYQTMLMKNGLSDSEYIVMFAILSLGEGCLQKDIAENGFMSKKTINSTIKKLQKEEILQLKAGKYPNMHIYLTKKGQEYIKQKVIPVIETENVVLNSMSSDAFDILVGGYTKYIERFRELVDSFINK